MAKFDVVAVWLWFSAAVVEAQAVYTHAVQEGDTFASIAQRRHIDPDHGQVTVGIGAYHLAADGEPLTREQRPAAAVPGGDDEDLRSRRCLAVHRRGCGPGVRLRKRPLFTAGPSPIVPADGCRASYQ